MEVIYLTTLSENWLVADERANRQFQEVLKNMGLLLFCALEGWIMVSLLSERTAATQFPLTYNYFNLSFFSTSTDHKCHGILPSKRQECGYLGIQREECEISRDCCFDHSIPNVPFCFKGNP